MLSQVPPRARAGWFEAQPRAEALEPQFSPGRSPRRPGQPRAGPACTRSQRGGAAGGWSARGRQVGGPAPVGRVYLARRKPGRRGRSGGRARPSEQPPDCAAAPARTSLRPRRPAAPTPKAAPALRDPARLGPGRREAARTPRRPRPWREDRRAVGDLAGGAGGGVALSAPPERGRGDGARGSPGAAAQVAAGGTPAATVRGVDAGVDADPERRGCPRRVSRCGQGRAGAGVAGRAWEALGVEFWVGGGKGQGSHPGRCGTAAGTSFRAGRDPRRLTCSLRICLELTADSCLPPPPARAKTSFPLSAEGGDRRLSGLPPSGGRARPRHAARAHLRAWCPGVKPLWARRLAGRPGGAACSARFPGTRWLWLLWAAGGTVSFLPGSPFSSPLGRQRGVWRSLRDSLGISVGLWQETSAFGSLVLPFPVATG